MIGTERDRSVSAFHGIRDGAQFAGRLALDFLAMVGLCIVALKFLSITNARVLPFYAGSYELNEVFRGSLFATGMLLLVRWSCTGRPFR